MGSSFEKNWRAGGHSLTRRFFIGAGSLAFAAIVWLNILHVFFQPKQEDFFAPTGVPTKVRELARFHLDLWNDPLLREKELKRMRGSNAEWDFMGRTFLVLALANLSLRDPSYQQANLSIIDRIVDETVALEKEKSIYFFLMDYAKGRNFLASPARSLFIDGEIALMMAARRMVAEKEEYRASLANRVQFMVSQMQQSPVLSGESYPNECWTFCNSVALASIKLHDLLDHTDHSQFLKDWVERARQKLVHPGTGLLNSSFTLDGAPGDGPEGTSIWLVAHMLQIIDSEFAKDQYWKGRKELAKSLWGFGYAGEWPSSCKGDSDIDSGPIIPFIELSAGSTGLAFLGATAFGDREFLNTLLASLEYGAFPMKQGNGLRYAGSNQVGDAVLLYALTNGPLWEKAGSMMKQ